MGVRSVPVLDREMRLTGVITRKDLLTHTIMHRLSIESYLTWMKHNHAAREASSAREPRGEANKDARGRGDEDAAGTFTTKERRQYGVPVRRSSNFEGNLDEDSDDEKRSVQAASQSGSLPSNQSFNAGPPSMHLLRSAVAQAEKASSDKSSKAGDSHDASALGSRRCSANSDHHSDDDTRGVNLWQRLIARRSNARMLDELADGRLDALSGMLTLSGSPPPARCNSKRRSSAPGSARSQTQPLPVGREVALSAH